MCTPTPRTCPARSPPEGLGAWLDDRAHLALGVVGKPLVVGEIGFPRDDARFVPRAPWFEAALGRADEDGISGVMVWIYRSWDERRDPHGIWDEGPLGPESGPVRAVLRGAATAWAEEPATLRNPVVRDAAPDARLYPTGIAHLRPWTEGRWAPADGRDRDAASAAAGEQRLTIDFSAFAEGCALDDDRAWLVYAIDMGRPGVPAQLVFEALGPDPVDPGLDHRIDVIVDETHVGTWDGPGRYESVGDGAREAAFAGEGTAHWVRLEATAEAGRAHLARMITRVPPLPGAGVDPEVPAEEHPGPVEAVTVRARWASPATR